MWRLQRLDVSLSLGGYLLDLLLPLLQHSLLLLDDLEVLELSHQLVHLQLLYPDELLQAVDLDVLVSESFLRAVQLLAVLVGDLLLEGLNVPLEVLLGKLDRLLRDI